MKALVVSILISLSSYASQTPLSPLCVDCFNFAAPLVNGASNISAVEQGLLILDTSDNTFKGADDNGDFVNLSTQIVTADPPAATALPGTMILNTTENRFKARPNTSEWLILSQPKTIAFRVTMGGTQTFNSTLANFNFANADIDYNKGGGSWNDATDQYTVPEDGLYRINLQIRTEPVTYDMSDSISGEILVNGTVYQVIHALLPDTGTTTQYGVATGTVVADLSAGDTIEFQGKVVQGPTNDGTVGFEEQQTWVEITRVGI